MSLYWNVYLMMVTVTETCSKLYIIEYIVVFWLNDILVRHDVVDITIYYPHPALGICEIKIEE